MKLFKHPEFPGLWIKYEVIICRTISGPRGIVFEPYYHEHRHLKSITAKSQIDKMILVAES